MKCIIPGPNVKAFAKAIHALAKIGDEMYLQPQQDGLSFRSVNLANSAYAEFTFQECFFSYYVYGDIEDEDAQKCKISMRSAIGVFKTPNVLDKQVESCHLKLDSNVEEVMFLLKYKNGISKTYIVPILDCGKLKVAYKKDDVGNKVSYQPKVFADALQIFQQNLIEITLEVLPEKMVLRNYTDDASGSSHVTRTQLALTVGEFESYSVTDQTALTFCLKELKAMLSFAESAGASLNMYFEAAGKPIVFILKDPTFEANLVLATVNPEAGSQTETTISGKKEACRRRNTSSRGNKKAVKSSRKDASTEHSPNKFLSNASKTVPLSTKSPHEGNSNGSPAMEDVVIDDRETPESVTSRFRTKDQKQLNDRQAAVPGRRRNKISATTSSTNTSLNWQSPNRSLQAAPIATNSEGSNVRTPDSENMNDDDLLLECVPSSPPPAVNRKARLIFERCFQSTFDPRMLPGHDEILAEASDEEC